MRLSSLLPLGDYATGMPEVSACSQPQSIRNLSWAVVRDGNSRRHVYRRDVDLHLKDGKITEITPAGARPTGPGEDVDRRHAACWRCPA